MRSPGKRVAFLSVLTALGMILSYLEALIPVFYGVPGMKAGLGNILVVFLLYTLGRRDALIVNLLRISLTALLFGNPYSFVYSLCGAALSFAVMVFLKEQDFFSCYGVSMAGGIAHNIGQIIVALFLVENYRIILYLPFLVISGCITGAGIAFIAAMVIKRIGRRSVIDMGT